MAKSPFIVQCRNCGHIGGHLLEVVKDSFNNYYVTIKCPECGAGQKIKTKMRRVIV